MICCGYEWPLGIAIRLKYDFQKSVENQKKMVFGDDLLISLQFPCWFIEPETVFQFHARKQLSVTGNFDFDGPQECFNWFIHNYGPSKSKSFAVISIRS